MKTYNWEERNIITMKNPEDVVLHTNDLHVWYGDNEAIKGVDLQFEKNKVTSFRLWEIDVSAVIKSNER